MDTYDRAGIATTIAGGLLAASGFVYGSRITMFAGGTILIASGLILTR